MCVTSFPSSEVESHPFELDTMLFMDWRDDHTQDNPAMRDANEKLPTFLYAMPFTKNKVIWWDACKEVVRACVKHGEKFTREVVRAECVKQFFTSFYSAVPGRDLSCGPTCNWV